MAMRFVLPALCAVCLACDADDLLPILDDSIIFTITPNPVPTLSVGVTLQLHAVPSVQAKMTWSSSNPAVATVDSTGLVRTISVGTVLITASTVNPAANSAVAITVGNVSGPPKGATATAFIDRIVDQNGNNIDPTALRGFIQVVARTDVPPTLADGIVRVKFRNEIICAEPYAGRQQFQHRCTFDTRRFANGDARIFVESVGPDGVIFTSATSQPLVLAN